MRRVSIMLAAVVAMASLSSCKMEYHDGSKEEFKDYQALLMHTAGLNQAIANLDPFNIAFRLNTLMIEAETAGTTDLNDPLVETTRKALFGAATTLADQGNGVYLINYKGAAAKYDYVRDGQVKINTRGDLMRDNNTWSVSSMDADGYTISVGSTLVSIITGGYSIKATDTNQWSATLNGYENTSEGEYDADWSGTLTITQDEFPGDQSYAKIKTSTYSYDFSSSDGVTTMYGPEKITMKGKNLQFSPKCDKNVVTGSGYMSVKFTESYNEFDITSSTWSGTATDCESPVKKTYLGM